jgi:hypothetical protein
MPRHMLWMIWPTALLVLPGCPTQIAGGRSITASKGNADDRHISEHISERGVANAVPSTISRGLVAFTLIRGGPAEATYDMFVNSRRCLRTAMPAVIQYDNVAFHEGNVPGTIELLLLAKVYTLECRIKR